MGASACDWGQEGLEQGPWGALFGVGSLQEMSLRAQEANVGARIPDLEYFPRCEGGFLV